MDFKKLIQQDISTWLKRLEEARNEAERLYAEQTLEFSRKALEIERAKERNDIDRAKEK